MSRLPRLVVGGLVAVLAGLSLAALSGVPWTASPEDRAVLRLAWRARAERVEECRPLTEEERAARPAHMRPDEICEGRPLPYRLAVRIDGREVVDDTLHGSGAREDRPVYVFRDLPVEPGERTVEVRFERLGPTETASPAEGIPPPALSFDRSIRFGNRDVAVVTYDPDHRRLVRVTPGTWRERE